MHVKSWLFSFLTGLAILFLCGFLIFQSDWFQKRYVYPLPYQDTIYQYSLENDLNPYLVAAVIRTESKFNPRARSPKGATGLMQMMPETAQWVAAQIEIPLTSGALTDPETNIRLGTWYLASLEKEFGANEVLILAAYNAGRGNVRQWMRQNGWNSSFRDIQKIPFIETRNYVQKVLRDEKRYQDLYGK